MKMFGIYIMYLKIPRGAGKERSPPPAIHTHTKKEKVASEFSALTLELENNAVRPLRF